MQISVFAENIETEYINNNENEGYIPLKELEVVDIESGVSQPVLRKGTMRTTTSYDLPTSYDAVAEGLVTEAKDQGNTGSCWAFSTVSCMESNMIKKGYEDVDTVDYSERHLAYFVNTRNTIFNDGTDSVSSLYGYYGGGNPIYAGQYLVGWQGAELEVNYPFAASGNMENLPASARYSSYAHLQDFERIDKSEVKAAIMEYGSVSAGYFYDGASYSLNYAYYYQGNAVSGSNHAITVVGWDDNYAISNFDGLEHQPSSPGAWKVKNSWGSTWGNEGCFWISYEEPTLRNFIVFNMEQSSNYHVNYQYDGAIWGTLLTVPKAANIFTATDDQNIKAVGFYTDHNSVNSAIVDPVNYTASLYLLNDNFSNPEDGTLSAVVSGTVTHDGYHTAEFSQSVPITAGSSFSVVVQLKKPNNTYAYYAFEGTCDNNSSHSQESFYYNGVNWVDSSSQYNNACIKAYASYENHTVTYNSNGGSIVEAVTVPKHSLLEIPENPQKTGVYFAGWYKDPNLGELWDFEEDTVTENMTLYAKWADEPIVVEEIELSADKSSFYVGESINITAKISPYYATNQELLWWTNNNCVTVATNGLVVGVSAGECIISAAASNGVYSQYTVNVYNPMGEITFLMEKPVYKTTDTVRYVFSEENAEHFDLYIVFPDGTARAARNIANRAGGRSVVLSLTYEEGQYTAYIQAFDAVGSVVTSKRKTFWVTNSPTLVVRYLEEDFQVGGYNSDEASEIIVVNYEDDSIVSVRTIAIAANASNPLTDVDFGTDETSIKFMWWDSKTGMVPKTEPITVNNSLYGVFAAQ